MEAGYCSGKTTHFWGGSHKFDSHPVLKIPEELDSVLDSAVKTGDQNKDQTGALLPISCRHVSWICDERCSDVQHAMLKKNWSPRNQDK